MAQRRPIFSHPAFVPLAALWFAALLGLGVAVLPALLLEGVLAAAGLDALVPLTLTGRVIASTAAALAGALLGIGLARTLARRARHDPRPIYADDEPVAEQFAPEAPTRRPLRVREELEEGFAEETSAAEIEDGWNNAGEAADSPPAQAPVPPPAAAPVIVEGDEGFMILTPQPVHPSRPAPDLDSLLSQFDSALAAFRVGEDARPSAPSGPTDPDPVHAFVARQTGAPSPLGGRMPDHQAELRAALDKLARAHRKD